MDGFRNARSRATSYALPLLQRPASRVLAWVAIGGLIAVAAGRAASAEVTGRVSVEASKALDELVSVDFDEVPYNRAVRQIRRRSSVPIRMDSKSLTEDWLAVDEPITLHARQITLRSALNLMTQAANPNLDWTIRDAQFSLASGTEKEDAALMGRIRKAGKTDQADMRRHCGSCFVLQRDSLVAGWPGCSGCSGLFNAVSAREFAVTSEKGDEG